MSLRHLPGFTIVELAVTIAVMSILFGIATINLNSTQVRSRDEERRGDARNIAAYLDNAYTVGFSQLGGMKGSYPSTDHITTNGVAAVFDGLDMKSLQAPQTNPSSNSLVVATNNVQTTTGVMPQPTVDTYVYQPIAVDGSLCVLVTTECRKFNIYIKLETDGSVEKVSSKYQ